MSALSTSDDFRHPKSIQVLRQDEKLNELFFNPFYQIFDKFQKLVAPKKCRKIMFKLPFLKPYFLANGTGYLIPIPKIQFWLLKLVTKSNAHFQEFLFDLEHQFDPHQLDLGHHHQDQRHLDLSN